MASGYLPDCDACQDQSFLEGIVIFSQDGGKGPAQERITPLRELGNRWVMTTTLTAKQRAPVSSGRPCLVFGNMMKPIYRLFDDSRGAFLATLQPNRQGLFPPP
jgi:hypothetical protein